MFRIAACVYGQHNFWIVLLAAATCIAACAGAFFVLSGLNAGAKDGRGRWLLLAGVLAGGGTWATHFVAMLGYDPGLPIGFAPAWTLLSAATCVVGAWAAFECYDRFRSWRGCVAAGVILGAAIAGMHYLGMTGVDAGARRVWAPDLLVASILLSVGISIAALFAFSNPRVPCKGIVATGLLVLAIVSLHFTGMSALTLVPDPRLPLPESGMDRQLLAVIIAGAAAAMLLVGVVIAFADHRVVAVELKSARNAARAALHDVLTGLPNRRHLFETLDEMLPRAMQGDKFAVVAVDLDRFKAVNDLYGHAIGDQLLVKVARMLLDGAGVNGFVARLGGDEFVLVLPFSAADELISRLSSIVMRFTKPIQLSAHQVTVGVTMGVAIAPTDADAVDILLRRADVALYRAKEDGKGRFAFFESGMDARVHERAALEQELRLAVSNDEIVPHFQPLVQLHDNVVSGYEVLARWPHKTRGLIDPALFIKIATETGLIDALTFNVLRRACKETLSWPGAPRISINIAPVQLRDADLPQKILAALAECGFPPARLEIEITEDALVSNFEAARAILLSFKNLGIRVALDDFGTGYSSLRHLRELPFDILKIDQSFVHGMAESSEALTIVKTIVQLAQNLGLAVTAEGIETAGQALQLQELGCDRGQGFHLGRPSAGSIEIAAKPQAPEDNVAPHARAG